MINNRYHLYTWVFAVSLTLLSLTSFAKLSDVIPTDEVFLTEEESEELTSALPKAVQQLFYDEIDLNGFFMDEENLKEFERLGDFSPTKRLWFYLPHLEIPLSDFEKLNVSAYIDPDYRKLFAFTKGGKKHIRYFLHPFRDMKNYNSALKKYPVKYTYVARPTSSPRSLIVINPKKPERPEWVKVSLHVKVTDLQRRQKLEKLARALAVNEALEQIEPSVLKKLKFGWLPESLAAKLPNKEEVIIGRDIEPYIQASTKRKKLRSTFAFFAAKDGEKPELQALIRKSGMNEFKFIEKYFIYPAIRVFAYLGFVEGIQWGMHTANYMTETGANGMPTGYLALKDFDGSWFDVETRMLRRRSMDGIHEMMNEPFAEFLFPSASGRNSGKKQHFGEIYNRYIRNANGFSSLGSLIYNYLLKYGNTRMKPAALKRKVQDMIDTSMIAQVKEYTGLDFNLADMRGGHLKTNGINKALNHVREQLLDETSHPQQVTEPLQKVLKQEFLRLHGKDRVWTSFARNKASIQQRFSNSNTILFYDAESGIIQVRTYRGAESEKYSITGYALLEGYDTKGTQSFLQKVKAKATKESKSCSDYLLVWLLKQLQQQPQPQLNYAQVA